MVPREFATTTQPISFTLFKDLNKFIRDLTVQRFYSIQATKNLLSIDPHGSIIVNHYDDLDWLTQHCPTSPPITHSNLRPTSVFNPTYCKGPYLQTFYLVVYTELIQMCKPGSSQTHLRSNLSTLEHQALEPLMNNDNIIIKPVDKGGSIVVQDRTDYLQDSSRLLSDISTYQTLSLKTPLLSTPLKPLILYVGP